MNIRPIMSRCENAQATHLRLELEAWELEELDEQITPQDTQDVFVRTGNRQLALILDERFLQTTVEACEVCEMFDPENPQCPNENTFGFITDKLTK